MNLCLRVENGPSPVKSYVLCDGVINLTETCLLVRWQASYKRQELYPGSIMELENLHGNDGQQRATREWKSGCRRETYNGNTPEAVNRCIMQGQTNS